MHSQTSLTGFRRAIVAGALATAMTGTFLAATVSPSYAETAPAAQAAPLTVQDWVQTVEKRINEELRTPAQFYQGNGEARANVQMKLDADGQVVGTEISRSSRLAAVDAEVLRVAKAIGPLPALPVGLRGKPIAVELQVYLGSDLKSPTPRTMRAEASAANAMLETRMAEAAEGATRS